MQKLPRELRSLVKNSVDLLGHVIRKQAGSAVFNKVERVREEMKEIRSSPDFAVSASLSRLFQRFQKMKPDERRQIAHSFSLMMELINTCETAYRTFRLRQKPFEPREVQPESITFVLTAHPTEARSPQLIQLFQQIQQLLIEALSSDFSKVENSVEHFLHMCWMLPLTRHQKPTVADEAESVNAIVLRRRSLLGYIELWDRGVPFKVRSWVGGDKDGHPGVNASVTLRCLSRSRKQMVEFIIERLEHIEGFLKTVSQSEPSLQELTDHLRTIKAGFLQRVKVYGDDGVRITQLTKNFEKFCKIYESQMGVLPEEFVHIQKLMKIFPGLVIPLELRDSAEVFKQTLEQKKETAILGILKGLQEVSRGGEPQWYLRGVVVSHTESVDDLLRVIQLQKKVFGFLPVPVIPLFESEAALLNGKKIVSHYLDKKDIRQAVKRDWESKVEVMVGYSDSAKQSGSLPSRLMIYQSIHQICDVVESAQMIPIFFHGSGGSVARGGGSLQEQTAWWPKVSLNYPKMTVQGEMIQRTFASREILNSQLQKISDAHATSTNAYVQPSGGLERFSDLVKEAYREKIKDEGFLDMVSSATPYRFLSELKMGSRPSKRSDKLAFDSLRAIPWVLCWTQTRVLYPTWWGVGYAWSQISKSEKERLKKEFEKSPVFSSYIKQLGFTLEKVELSVFRLYLQHSRLSSEEVENVYEEFTAEYKAAVSCVRAITQKRDLLWFRPWLKESIHLRSSMIHPLNVLQLVALSEDDFDLLRKTVTGIASGMLTTG